LFQAVVNNAEVKPRYCICTNASRGLTATVEFIFYIYHSIGAAVLYVVVAPTTDYGLIAPDCHDNRRQSNKLNSTAEQGGT